MSTFTRVRRIGITGASGAGKTSFLLSLISNLQNGNWELKVNGKKVGKTDRFKQLPFKGDKLQHFNYDGLRNYLAEHRDWPHKTTDSHIFRCEFKTNKLSHRLEFYDFPGERVADILMVGKSYEEWSEDIIKLIEDDPAKSKAAAVFLNTLKNTTGQIESAADRIVGAWKLALSRLLLNCHSLISPSTFLVDQNGEDVEKRLKKAWPTDESARNSPEKITEVSWAGLAGREFAPLPDAMRKSAPELARCFKNFYEEYQKQVVRPFENHLFSCNGVIFLMDIPDILASGMQKLKDQEALLEGFLRCIDKKRGGWLRRNSRSAWDFALERFSKKAKFIEKVAFVASKADQIAKGNTVDSENDQARLEGLLKSLVMPAIRQAGPKKHDYFTCKAVNSTEQVPSEHGKLKGRPKRLLENKKVIACSPSDEPKIVEVPSLPKEWPDITQWNEKDFAFVEFFPNVPGRPSMPLQEVGLNLILDFIL